MKECFVNKNCNKNDECVVLNKTNGREAKNWYCLTSIIFIHSLLMKLHRIITYSTIQSMPSHSHSHILITQQHTVYQPNVYFHNQNNGIYKVNQPTLIIILTSIILVIVKLNYNDADLNVNNFFIILTYLYQQVPLS